MYVGKSPFAYAELITRLWADGESFLTVEHDIELTERAVRQARYCKCKWGVSPYHNGNISAGHAGLLKGALGCTRFRSELLREFPSALGLVNALDDGGHVAPPRHYKRLDARLLGVLRQAGYEPHLHDIVPHHHVYENGCACGEEH